MITSFHLCLCIVFLFTLSLYIPFALHLYSDIYICAKVYVMLECLNVYLSPLSGYVRCARLEGRYDSSLQHLLVMARFK